MKRTIDIIIPIYNQEKYLKRCLESIVTQDLENVHLILVDDGSIDESLQLCNIYKNMYPNKITVIHKENGGLSSARNAGIQISESDYITFVDSDDYVEKDYIKEIRSFIEQNNLQNTIIAFSYQIKHIDFGTTQIILKDGIQDVGAGICYLEEKNLFNSCCNKVYQRSILKENNIQFVLNGEPGEDLIFNCHYFKKIEHVQISSKILYNYMRNGEDSQANKFRSDLWKKNKHFIKEIEDLFNFFRLGSPYQQNLLAEACIRYIYSNIPNMYRGKNKFSKKQRIEFYREILDNKRFQMYFSIFDSESKLFGKLKKLYLKQSPNKLDRYYSFAMYVRNHFSVIYNFIRKKFIKA